LNAYSRLGGLHLHLRLLLWLRNLNLRGRLVDLDLGLDHGNIHIRPRHLYDDFRLGNVDGHSWRRLSHGYLGLRLPYRDLGLCLLYRNLWGSLVYPDCRRRLLDYDICRVPLWGLGGRGINLDQSIAACFRIIAGLVGANLLDGDSDVCRMMLF